LPRLAGRGDGVALGLARLGLELHAKSALRTGGSVEGVGEGAWPTGFADAV